jgi:flagellar motor switch protein FliN/FliY
MVQTISVRDYADALVGELASAIEAILGGPVAVSAGAKAAGNGWVVTFGVSGELIGSISAWMDQAGSATIAKRVMGLDEEPDAAIVADMLGEMWQQAAGALVMKDPYTGVKLSAGVPSAADAADRPLVTYALNADASAIATLSLTAAIEAPQPKAAPSQSPLASLPQSASLDVVLDIDLPLIVRFGRTQMTLKMLAALGPGSIVDMGRSPDAPVEMLVGEQVIARGEVVIVSGNYGVRITDLVSPADRVRALEA